MRTKEVIGRLLSTIEESQRAAARELALKAQQGITRVLSGAAVEAPNTASTASAYRVDLTAGVALIDGEGLELSAADDQDFLGESAEIPSYQLDGTAAEALENPGESVKVAVLAYRNGSDELALAGVFGAVATGYAEAVRPTLAQCREALRLAGIDWDGINGLWIGATEFGLALVETITVGAGVAENDQFEITVGEIASSTTAGASSSSSDIAAALISELTTNLAALPVTVGGSGAAITLTWDAGEEPEDIELDNGASSAELAYETSGAIWQSVTSASTDTELIAARAAGSLWG